MIDREALERERADYQGDTIDGQLARLRANLDIVATRIADPSETDVVKRAIDQSAWFTEWACQSTQDEDVWAVLADCGRFAARCRYHWAKITADPVQRAAVAAEAAAWSARILPLFGLLTRAS
jgi:hypothetical protein